MYRDLFCYLESINLVDPNNELDLYCLHYVFIPHINSCLATVTIPSVNLFQTKIIMKNYAMQ